MNIYSGAFLASQLYRFKLNIRMSKMATCLNRKWMYAKGQLISKCLFGVIVSTKIAFWSFLGTSQVISLIRKPTGSPKKLPGSPQEATKKLQGRNPFRCYFGQNDDTKKTFRN